MKIDAIVLREIRMPLLEPFVTSFGRTTDRRVLLAEIRAEGLVGWGECVAGEHPYFSPESIDTAWVVLMEELAPALAAAEVHHGGDCPKIFRKVRGNPMAKAALENAIWDLEAQMERAPLYELLGGTQKRIACGVSIGMQPTMDDQLARVERELAAGYRRIKLKCQPGWDIEMLEAVRRRWPSILLSVDANSAYRMRDFDHLVEFDRFDLLMIEQPLWADDFYFHSMLQKRLETAICLDECIRNRRDALAAIDMESCRILNIKNGRVGGFSEAIAVHNVSMERGIPVWCGGMLETGIGRAHNIALSTLPGFTLPGDVSASKRYWKDDIIEPAVEVTPQGEIVVPQTPGRGYEVRTDLVERLTVRREEVRALQPA
jgi:O-succinylbenzoate synthase